MRASAGLHLDYVSLAEYKAAGWGDVLGVATFSGTADAVPAPAAEIPVAQVSTPVLPGTVLAGTGHVFEVWRCSRPAASGRRQRVRFRRTADMLFGCIAVSEAQLATAGAEGASHAPAGHGGPRSALHEATTQAYREICATLDAENYPHLLRVWNYLPDINRDNHGTERYRQFNSARHHALRESGRSLAGNVPAASALGAASDSPLVVYFLAGRTAPCFVENPRQLSAYRYPRQYGLHSPAFSRATLWRQPEGLALFISGTASIVGHRSLHIGDTAAQTRETLTNIDALLAEANRVARGAHFRLGALALKVYVRRPADLAVIKAELAAALGDSARIIYLQADICRQDLLVEIEATGMCPLDTAA
jgi:enamine deaminase RidA (YjgF/YER057c/UK114 family)